MDIIHQFKFVKAMIDALKWFVKKGKHSKEISMVAALVMLILLVRIVNVIVCAAYLLAFDKFVVDILKIVLLFIKYS